MRSVTPTSRGAAPDPRLRRVASYALLAALLPACNSTQDSAETSASSAFGTEGAPEHPISAQAGNQDRSVGKYLADLDTSIRAWMDKTWMAASREDRQKQDKLELHLETEARRGQAELLVQLESGPVRNRIIAATALGFTRDPAVLSPLLGALEDQSPEVEQNALIGLSLLLSPETPLAPIVQRMGSGAKAAVRASAAYCVRCLIEVGAQGEGVLEAARSGLVDEDPIVRSQCALILALLRDGEAIAMLSFLLADEVELVAAAAARGIAYLGRELPEIKGEAARALTDPLADAEGRRRLVLLRNLVGLAGKNYGEDLDAWIQWSRRLP